MSKIETEPKGPEFAEIPGEYRFCVLRPGGNDTGLVAGIVEDSKLREVINDQVMAASPTVEQVGFISLTPDNIQLQMAGGEFCGNATRSTAWLALGGQPGEISIQVSGVSRRLRAGVMANGDAFAEMPIYSDVSKVTEDKEIPGNFLVEMEGIVQYIDFRPLDPTVSAEEIKAQSIAFIKECGLDAFPAAGIMYSTKTERGLNVTPVVFVPAAGEKGTLFLETACGSGTTALGMVLALAENRSITNVPIYQPSGLPIRVSVELSETGFVSAEISGPVEVVTPAGVVNSEIREEDL